MDAPGPLLAQGRDSDIYEYGPRRVLRRSREGGSMTVEARTMAYLHERGYPVPRVDEVSDDGANLVMERIEGRSMMDEMARRPWSLARYGALLAELHQRLHEIEAPAWLRTSPGAPGDRVLHLDLHPLNVMVSRAGPVVIDWPNAVRGDPNTDVAVTWALVDAGEIPANRLEARMLGWARAAFVRSFLRHFDLDAVRPEVPAVVAWKVRDPHMSARENEALRRLAASVSSGRG